MISSSLDVLANYIVRYLGSSVPSSVLCFNTGIVTTILTIIYCLIFEPFEYNFFYKILFKNPDENEKEYFYGLVLLIIGGTFGYLAIEFMIIGLKISKSGMAMFAE